MSDNYEASMERYLKTDLDDSALRILRKYDPSSREGEEGSIPNEDLFRSRREPSDQGKD